MAGRLNRLLRSCLSSAIFYARRWGCTGAAVSPGVRILTYHGMGGHQSPLGVTPQAFAAQTGYLSASEYHVISLEEFYQAQKEAGALPDRAVVIISHDGYMDDYLGGFPILQHHGFPATVFLATGFIGRQFQGGRMLNWLQIREMSRHGISFGSHSVIHRFLTRVPLEVARREIRESKLALEETLGQGVAFLFYPFGDFDGVIKTMVRECGYLGACTIFPGANSPLADVSSLKTTDIGPKDTSFDLEKKLMGAYDLIHRGLQLLSKGRFSDRYFGPRG